MGCFSWVTRNFRSRKSKQKRENGGISFDFVTDVKEVKLKRSKSCPALNQKPEFDTSSLKSMPIQMENKNQTFVGILQKLWINSSRDLAMRSPVFKQVGTYHPEPTRRKQRIKRKLKGDFLTSSDEEINGTLHKLVDAIEQIDEIIVNSPRGPKMTPPIPKPRKSLMQLKTDVIKTDYLESTGNLERHIKMVQPLVKPHHQVMTQSATNKTSNHPYKPQKLNLDSQIDDRLSFLTRYSP